MSRTVTVDELREKLEEIIAEVEAGGEVTVVKERKARRGVAYPFRNFDFGTRPANLTTDPAELIIEERERERSGKKHGL